MQSEIYDFTEISHVQITDRSCFYSINPIGLGTPFVESLTSYINRLAKAHNVRTIDLLRYEVSNFLKSDYLISELNQGGLNEKCRYLNGDSSVAKEFVTAMEFLVRKDNLLYSTLIPFSSAYYISTKGLIKEKKEWCPLCYGNKKRHLKRLTIY